MVCLMIALCVTYMSAQSAQNASHMVPTGKGWAESHQDAAAPQGGAVVQGNGISYHGGPVMGATPNIYVIWYGNWSGSGSNSATSVSLITSLVQGIGNSGYEKINSTYGDNSTNVTGNVAYAGSTSDNYSQGTRLRDASVQKVVANAIANGSVPQDTNGLYFVLTSSDVTETSGFCTKYCGWHTHGTISGADIKYSFVGNPDRCPSACNAQTTTPNGDSGADGMASIIAHEMEEAISDPDLNAWYDSSGAENADKCAWKFGPESTASNGSKYNQTIGGHNWLIQMNWENSRGGGCDQTQGGTFYTN
jgi:hypothetical protein